jgi:P27 family predicted phage terminase small subunit
MPKAPGKPPLSIVSTETTGISPPRPLGPHGKALWDRVQREYQITDTGGIELLAQACAALDRAEALAEAITRDGEVIHTRTGVPKTHPAVKDELACRAFVVRTLERLGLNIEAIAKPGRPAKPYAV